MAENRSGSVAGRSSASVHGACKNFAPSDDLFPDVIFRNLSADLRLKLRHFLCGEWCEEKEIDCSEWDDLGGAAA